MAKLKIISDGTGIGTRIVDAETGEDIPGLNHIREIRWRVSSENLGIATVEFDCLIPVEVIGECEQVTIVDAPQRTCDPEHTG